MRKLNITTKQVEPSNATTLHSNDDHKELLTKQKELIKEVSKAHMTKEEFYEFFEEITSKMISVSRAKNSDYTGLDKSPFANFQQVEHLGICSTEQGFLTRMTDKLARISSFVAKGSLEVKDEAVEDTLLDLANYSILMMGYLKEKKMKNSTKRKYLKKPQIKNSKESK